MITLYGISNCSTVQKARNWLVSNQIEYIFHDYKKLGIDQAHLEHWCQKLGWAAVLNRAGMMWRKASEADKSKVLDQDSAIAFMIKVPNSIKRPIIEHQNGLIRGFDEAQYKDKFLL